jgi:hypothetical protein
VNVHYEGGFFNDFQQGNPNTWKPFLRFSFGASSYFMQPSRMSPSQGSRFLVAGYTSSAELNIDIVGGFVSFRFTPQMPSGTGGTISQQDYPRTVGRILPGTAVSRAGGVSVVGRVIAIAQQTAVFNTVQRRWESKPAQVLGRSSKLCSAAWSNMVIRQGNSQWLPFSATHLDHARSFPSTLSGSGKHYIRQQRNQNAHPSSNFGSWQGEAVSIVLGGLN